MKSEISEMQFAKSQCIKIQFVTIQISEQQTRSVSSCAFYVTVVLFESDYCVAGLFNVTGEEVEKKCHKFRWRFIPDLPTVCLRFSETTGRGKSEGTKEVGERGRKERDTRDREKRKQEKNVITLLATV